LLTGIVADADRLLVLAREGRGRWPAESAEDRRVAEAAALLSQLLLQDVERREEGPALRQGTAADRIVSVADPEMRHGRKSASKRFDGYKAALAVDTESQLITAVAVLPGNAADATGALALVEASEAATGLTVETTVGDCAYGSGELRREFAEAGRELVAKVPAQPNGDHFPKAMFVIDPAASSCTCPAGQTTTHLVRAASGGGQFHFAASICSACPLRAQCVKAEGGSGRTVTLHPEETRLQAARLLQSTAAGRALLLERQVAEHRLARLVQLGIRQARYFGRAKTGFQLLLAAAVANLTLLAGVLSTSEDHFLTIFASVVASLALITCLPTPFRHSASPANQNICVHGLRAAYPLSREQTAVSRPNF
jgi:IS5 family transposase